MDILKTLNSKKIKRRNFFLALGASAVGVLSLSKFPVKLFSSKLFRKIPGSASVKIKPNPLAVSRDKEGKDNG